MSDDQAEEVIWEPAAKQQKQSSEQELENSQHVCYLGKAECVCACIYVK